MKVLVVGGGGREHALVWKIARSPMVTKVFCAPGNPGIARHADCVDITPTNIEGLLDFALSKKVDLTVVGPEAPLVAGIVDLFESRKLSIVGPTREAAALEGSKAFTKALLRRHGIPTANFRHFTDAAEARRYASSIPAPLVVKADGLAGGKGAVICRTREEAMRTIDEMMVQKVFGEAGACVVVEEFLTGIEASVIALTDGSGILLLEHTQDHKRLLDGDRGPNTGGMGAYSPAPVVPEREYDRVVREVLVQIVHVMKSERRPFKGILYAGIMFTRGGPRVLEFNVRFGDPECQPLMMRMKSDLVPVLLDTATGQIGRHGVEWDPRAAVCVVMAAEGYPGKPVAGAPIEGVEPAEAEDVCVFHAGTARRDGKLVTAGGRVLGVTALGESIAAARDRAYAAVGRISFRGAHFRKDIAHQAAGAPPKA
jgi:phosphoribosylamine--glycine ligase